MDIKEYTNYNEDEILALYNDAGWVAYTQDKDALRRGYENSLIKLGAYEGDKLIGIIRAVGDGATIVFVQDIIVLKEHQREGVGTKLLKEVLDRFSNVRQIELVTDNTPKTIAFYKSVGFRPLDEIGCAGFMKF